MNPWIRRRPSTLTLTGAGLLGAGLLGAGLLGAGLLGAGLLGAGFLEDVAPASARGEGGGERREEEERLRAPSQDRARRCA